MLKKRSSDKFKKDILRFYDGIPDYKFYGYIEKNFKDEEVRDYLLKKDVFVKSEQKDKHGRNLYFLGTNGINLALSFKMENLTYWIMGLTCVMLVFAVVQILVTLYFG